jgi:predicted nucleotide-binding protein
MKQTKKQRNYPPLTLERALAVAQAIQDRASGMPVDKLTLGDLMGNSPGSSTFQNLVAASRMYGLTTGGINATDFKLTPRGDAATGADEVAQQQARRQAVLSIEPYKIFLEAFADKRLPAEGFSTQYLIKNCKVDADRAAECLKFMLADARKVGFIHVVKDNDWINLRGTAIAASRPTPTLLEVEDNDGEDTDMSDVQGAASNAQPAATPPVEPQAPTPPKKIFIAHGKDHAPLEQLTKILDRLKIPYAVAVDEANRGRPISAKVANLMKNECGSAIVIFSADERFTQMNDKGEEIEVWRPSENVVYELGAASILYENRIVIFKDKKINLPSNFRDLGYISFEEGEVADQTSQLIQELVALGVVEMRVNG